MENYVRKLELNREQIISLEEDDATRIHGGDVAPSPTHSGKFCSCSYYFTCRPTSDSYCQTKVAE